MGRRGIFCPSFTKLRPTGVVYSNYANCGIISKIKDFGLVQVFNNHQSFIGANSDDNLIGLFGIAYGGLPGYKGVFVLSTY